MEIKNTPNHHFYSSSTSKPYSRTENCYKNMWLNTYRRELGEDRTSFQLYRFQHTPVKFEENLPANMNHADPRIAYLNISAITSTGWKADESDVPLDLSLQPKDMSLRSQPALQPHCQNFCSNIRRKSLTREERITKFSLLHNDNQENESEKFSKKMVSPQSRIMFTQNKVSAQEIDPRDTRCVKRAINKQETTERMLQHTKMAHSSSVICACVFCQIPQTIFIISKHTNRRTFTSATTVKNTFEMDAH
ncbi:uncharacterized protein [Watersipora subatra]|uniref:uncharacterized protein isoform X2 n=1 Tax=Watersipora subatra TaxID=2589382 RepID=UPI00355AF59A